MSSDNFPQKKSTPSIILVGVLFFSIAVNFLSLKFKILIFCILIIGILFSKNLDSKLLLKNITRFRYLLISILFFNLLFLPEQYELAIDKMLLLLLIIIVVNIYLQLQSHKDIISASSQILRPLSILGVDNNKVAILFGETLNAVNKFQATYTGKEKITNDEKDDYGLNSNLFSSVSRRLAHWIMYIENNYQQKMK